jgi:hypothetical protein
MEFNIYFPLKDLLARHRKSIELINPPCPSVCPSFHCPLVPVGWCLMFRGLKANGFRLSLSPKRSLLRSSGKQNVYQYSSFKYINTHPSMKTATLLCLRLSSDAVNDPLAISIYPCDRQTGPSHIIIWVDAVLIWICSMGIFTIYVIMHSYQKLCMESVPSVHYGNSLWQLPI